MSCNTKTSLAAVIDAVNAQLNNNYVDRDDPRISQGVFTEPTIRGGLMLDEAAKVDLCGYIQDCGQEAPFGKQWLDRPLYPGATLVSVEGGDGEVVTKWQDSSESYQGLPSIAALKSIFDPKDGVFITVNSYHEGYGMGGGVFVWDSTADNYIDDCVYFKADSKAEGRFVRQVDGALLPEHGGAVGGDPEKDTLGLFNCLKHINEVKGGLTFHFGATYHLGTIYTSVLGADRPWEVALTKYPQCQLFFHGVNNLVIEGAGGIYVPDNGTPDYPHGVTTYSIFAFDACKFVSVRGLHINGNRLGQLHTLGSSTGHNHGVAVTETSSDITVEGCHIENLGSLRSGIDKRGDGIYVTNGASNIFFRGNTVKNVGRWACVLEFGPGGTNNYVIEDNTIFGAVRGVEPPNPNDWCPQALGFVDIESFKDHAGIIIRDNIIYNSGTISFAGSSSAAPEVVLDTIVIDNNIWHSETIGGDDGYDRVLNIAGVNSGSGTRRTINNLSFTNNKVYMGSEKKGVIAFNRVVSIERVTLQGVTDISNNTVDMYTGDLTGLDQGGIQLFTVRILGMLIQAGNTVKTTSRRLAWLGVRGLADDTLGLSNFTAIIRDNTIMSAHRGLMWGVGTASISNLHAHDNLIDSTYNRVSDLSVGLNGNAYIEASGLTPRARYVPPVADINNLITTKTSLVNVSDALKLVFIIAPTDVGKEAMVSITSKIEMKPTDIGDLRLEAKYMETFDELEASEGFKWVIRDNFSAVAGGARLEVAAVGGNLEISARKSSGGATVPVKLTGIFSLFNSTMTAVAAV